MIKKSLFLNSLLFGGLLLSLLSLSCNKEDNNSQNEDRYKLSGTASGAAERPNPVTSNGTGTISGTYHLENNLLEYSINWSGISGAPTGMHFHGPADVNTAASVALAITVPSGAGTSGTVTGSATLSDAQEADLLAGKWYYNIHTDTYKAGEIRGQVTAAP